MACDDASVTLASDAALARFSVEVAATVEDRGIGLMGRTEMPLSAGMLFVYDHPQSVSFWMRNTLIPLDMIFLDQTGAVVSIHENAAPLDETPIFGGDQIQYVLEINGGLASQLGLLPGARLQHPAIDQDLAIFPCEK